MACLTGVLILVVLVIAIEGLSDEMRMAAAQSTPEATTATEAEARAQREQLQQEVEALRRDLQARQQGAVVTEAEIDVLEARLAQIQQEITQLQAREKAMAEEAARLAAEAARWQAQMDELDDRRVKAEVALRRERVQFRPGTEAGRTPFFVEVAAAGVRLGEINQERAPVLTNALPPMATDEQVVGALAARSPASSYAVFVVHADAIARFEALRDAAFRKGYEVGWQLWDGSSGAFLEPAP